MCRSILCCLAGIVASLLITACGLGQEQGNSSVSPSQQDVAPSAESSVYALPGTSRPQQSQDTRLPPQPPLRQPAAAHREQAPIEATQFVEPLEQQPTGETAADTAPSTTYSKALNTSSDPKTRSATATPSPETSGQNKTREENPAGSDASITATGLAGLKELVPTSLPDAWDKLKKAWKYELFMKLTVETLTIALVLLFVGYLASKRISAWFASRILGRLGIGRNNVATVQTIAFYALMAAFTLSTLGALGVPVTVFSFLGGALAVGIGFGSQNIVNNFISGLILLAERPIRVGDVIQIDGATGKVTEIGARSTRITTGSNMEILVPNSTFLQTNVVNWTLSDDIISSKVTVGVAYGSPARQVAKLLLQAADQNADVLKDPAPNVSFTNFGDHSLDFELSFWLRLGQSDRGRIESDLRFAIDDLFAEHGIIIAYPQRDVHLNLLRPVEVRLTPPAAGDVRRAAA